MPATANNTNNTEIAGGTILETPGAETRADRTSTHSMSETDGAHALTNSMRDLPLYNEQAPNDEVVLLKQIRTLDGTDDHGGNENGNAPSAEVVPPYADSGSAPKVPQVTTTTAGSPRHSMDAAKSVQDLSRNSGSNATTTNPSTNSVEPQNAHVDNGPTPGAAVGPHAPPHGDLPT